MQGEFCTECGAAVKNENGDSIPQPQYTPPTTGYRQQNLNSAVFSTGQFILTMFLGAIPIVGFILMLIWAFHDGNLNRRNYARASLLWGVITLAVGIICTIVFGAFIGMLIDEIGYSIREFV